MAENIRQDIEALVFEYKGKQLKLTLSAGISEWHPEKTLSSMLSEADEGLYKAKQNGRNQIF